MPAITRKYIRANAYRTATTLCSQIEGMRKIVSTPKRVMIKDEILNFLAHLAATASEVRALLRIAVQDVDKELPIIEEPKE